MLWKPYRLHKNWEFQKIITKSNKVVNQNFVIFYDNNQLNNCQFGISIPQKLVKKAFARNHYKRQIRNILIQHLKSYHNSCQIDQDHNHYNFIIIIRPSCLNNDFADNQNSLGKLLLFIQQKKTVKNC